MTTAKIKFQIKSRWSDAVLFEGEYASQKECLQNAVEKKANLNGANLTRANLTRANLDGANLDGANLTRANLYGANLTRANLDGANLNGANLYVANLTRANLYVANLTRANLDGANLDGANLNGANLYVANLTRANLTGANLTRANLDGANLTRANLTGANLYVANLTRANLTRANLEIFKKDLIAEILKLPDELENLRDTIIAGKINGSSYTGDCACLAGTIAKHRGLDNISSGDEIKENGCVFVADSSSPRERWFMMIAPGQNPENHQPAKVALDWVNEAIVIRDHIRGKATA